MDRLFAPEAAPRHTSTYAASDSKLEEDETAPKDPKDRTDEIERLLKAWEDKEYFECDKNPGERARQAFEALNQAYKLLRDPNKMEDVLRKAAEKAMEEQERKEARALPSERIQINSDRLEKAKELRDKQGREFHDIILQQTKRRQHEARKKRGAVSRYRSEQDDGGSEEDKPAVGAQPSLNRDEDDEEYVPVVQRKKKKPTFI